MCAVIFLAALGVSSCNWQDNSSISFRRMTVEYRSHALVLLNGDLTHFLRGSNPPSDANVINTRSATRFSSRGLQSVRTSDTACARFTSFWMRSPPVGFFIAAELFPRPAALIPVCRRPLAATRLSLNSTSFPDPLAAPFILLASTFSYAPTSNLVCLLSLPRARASASRAGSGQPHAARTVSRVLEPFLFERGKRLRYAAALVGATFSLSRRTRYATSSFSNPSSRSR